MAIVPTEAPLPRDYAVLLCDDWRAAGVMPEGADLRLMVGPLPGEVAGIIEGTEPGDPRNEVAEVVVLARDTRTFLQVVDVIRKRVQEARAQLPEVPVDV